MTTSVKHFHILGICGTFMGSLALILRSLGHRVTGCDANVYPPMSTQLQDAGVQIIQGFDADQVDIAPDVFVVGNAMSRGKPIVEAILNQGLSYTSGPQCLAEYVLPHKWVLAVAGTHGKTTTATMLTKILDDAGYNPGYLIGGVPLGFEFSGRATDSAFFVIEADEYDSAFFDKRSKFVHYHPKTLIVNNLEFDHADIFDDLRAIQNQFHHVIRLVPEIGAVITPVDDPAIDEVLARGLWSSRLTIGAKGNFDARLEEPSGSRFEVSHHGSPVGMIDWSLTGLHNVHNALAAIAAAYHAGVAPKHACDSLSCFDGVKRRMEVIYDEGGVVVYDDFAHHPTAIETTLQGVRRKVGGEKIVAVLEPRSNTMVAGFHNDRLAASVVDADVALWLDPEHKIGLSSSLGADAQVFGDLNSLFDAVCHEIDERVHIVIMSNGGFGGLHQRVVSFLREQS